MPPVLVQPHPLARGRPKLLPPCKPSFLGSESPVGRRRKIPPAASPFPYDQSLMQPTSSRYGRDSLQVLTRKCHLIVAKFGE